MKKEKGGLTAPTNHLKDSDNLCSNQALEGKLNNLPPEVAQVINETVPKVFCTKTNEYGSLIMPDLSVWELEFEYIKSINKVNVRVEQFKLCYNGK